MNFLNPIYDGQRGRDWDAYSEYYPWTDRSQEGHLAQALRKFIQRCSRQAIQNSSGC